MRTCELQVLWRVSLPSLSEWEKLRKMLIRTSEMHTFVWLPKREQRTELQTDQLTYSLCREVRKKKKKITRLRKVFQASKFLMTLSTIITPGMQSEDTPESAGLPG